MQRSDLAVLVAGLVLAVPFFWLFEWVGIAVLVGGMLIGGAVGAVASRTQRSAAPAKVRKVPAKATRPVLMTRVAQGPRPTFEPAAARAQAEPLRLTGAILSGMQTGGKVTRGKCSRCASTIWLSAQRPVKARCPVCGHTRVLS